MRSTFQFTPALLKQGVTMSVIKTATRRILLLYLHAGLKRLRFEFCNRWRNIPISLIDRNKASENKFLCRRTVKFSWQYFLC
jgi:hypothetical protein